MQHISIEQIFNYSAPLREAFEPFLMYIYVFVLAFWLGYRLLLLGLKKEELAKTVIGFFMLIGVVSYFQPIMLYLGYVAESIEVKIYEIDVLRDIEIEEGTEIKHFDNLLDNMLTRYQVGILENQKKHNSDIKIKAIQLKTKKIQLDRLRKRKKEGFDENSAEFLVNGQIIRLEKEINKIQRGSTKEVNKDKVNFFTRFTSAIDIENILGKLFSFLAKHAKVAMILVSRIILFIYLCIGPFLVLFSYWPVVGDQQDQTMKFNGYTSKMLTMMINVTFIPVYIALIQQIMVLVYYLLLSGRFQDSLVVSTGFLIAYVVILIGFPAMIQKSNFAGVSQGVMSMLSTLAISGTMLGTSMGSGVARSAKNMGNAASKTYSNFDAVSQGDK